MHVPMNVKFTFYLYLCNRTFALLEIHCIHALLEGLIGNPG